MEEVGKLRVIPPGQPARLEPVVSLAESEPLGLGVCQGCTAVIDNNDAESSAGVKSVLSLLEVMGGSEAEVAGNALNHAEVPKYNVWNPKGSRSK